MSGLWDRFAGLTRRRSRGPRVVVVRDLAVAKTLPQRPRRRGPRRGEITNCSCGAPVEEVLFTTGTPAGDPLTWRAWPLAVDGWRCTKCDRAQAPRFLEADECVEIGKAAVDAATAGREEEAEIGFRRIVASWAGYRPGLSDLSTLLMVRATRLDLEGQTDLSLLLLRRRRGAPVRAERWRRARGRPRSGGEQASTLRRIRDGAGPSPRASGRGRPCRLRSRRGAGWPARARGPQARGLRRKSGIAARRLLTP